MSDLMKCPKCGEERRIGTVRHTDLFDEDVEFTVRCSECGFETDKCSKMEHAVALWNGMPRTLDKKEDNNKCPFCGRDIISSSLNGKNYLCLTCGWKWGWDDPTKNSDNNPDPNNPYTEFAKEMSLLHEALKAEGFKDAMVDILAAMSPVVWDKVQFEDQKHWLHKTLGINVDDLVAKCNHDNKRPRPENWGCEK